jgi:hypothetical protein
MLAGRPQKADPGEVYAFAHLFYWDFRRLSEGTARWLFDEEKYRALEKQALEAEIELTKDQRVRAREATEEEIARGILREEDRENRIRGIQEIERFATRDTLLRDASEQSRKRVNVPGEREVIELLLNPKATPEQIRELCKNSTMKRVMTVESGKKEELEVSAWPISAASTLPTYLSEFAEQYIEALNDPRFPDCTVTERPTNRLKQFWFLSRALAGALYGVKTRTAINLVGSLRPEQIFQETRDGKPARKRQRLKYKSRS